MKSKDLIGIRIAAAGAVLLVTPYSTNFSLRPNWLISLLSSDFEDYDCADADYCKYGYGYKCGHILPLPH